MEVDRAFSGRTVLVTGHTGFKGSWLALWLSQLGARVVGFSLPPPTRPSHFELAAVEQLVEHTPGDVRDREAVESVVQRAQPDLVFHLAAQPLVRESYRIPVDTFAINVLGTAHLLDAVRRRPCPVVVITSDKCYEPADHAHREDDKLGGHDPYSASKAAAELVAASYRRSFGMRIATARAGNVIGGGDWAPDRIVVDAMTALLAGEPIRVRSPSATRPFQHVLDPVHGYLRIGAALLVSDDFARPFNLGPDGEISVRELIEKIIAVHGGGTWVDASDPSAVHEAPRLRLDASRAKSELGWLPRWDLDVALAHTVAWYRAWHRGDSMRERSLADIAAYGPAGILTGRGRL